MQLKGDEVVVATVAARKAHQAVRKAAAFQEGVELIFHKLRQVDARSGSAYSRNAAECSCNWAVH